MVPFLFATAILLPWCDIVQVLGRRVTVGG